MVSQGQGRLSCQGRWQGILVPSVLLALVKLVLCPAKIALEVCGVAGANEGMCIQVLLPSACFAV